MLNRILYLHGAGPNTGPDDAMAQELRSHWPEAEVLTPQLPSPDGPEAPEQWQHTIARAIRDMPDEPWTLVAHSLGASETLRYLCKHRPALLRRVVVVGTPLWDAEGPGVAEDTAAVWWGPQWALPLHAGRLLAEIDVIILHAQDDPVVPVAHAHRLAQLLPSSHLKISTHGGHMPLDWVRKAV